MIFGDSRRMEDGNARAKALAWRMGVDFGTNLGKNGFNLIGVFPIIYRSN